MGTEVTIIENGDNLSSTRGWDLTVPALTSGGATGGGAGPQRQPTGGASRRPPPRGEQGPVACQYADNRGWLELERKREIGKEKLVTWILIGGSYYAAYAKTTPETIKGCKLDGFHSL
jgi:hypothetical protein